MGKNSNRESSKEKRQKMKQERQAVAISQKIVNKALELNNPLEEFKVFQQYNKNGLDLEIEFKKSSDLDEKLRNWIMDLEERNMKESYENCDIGWNLKSKKDEMMDDRAWYLLAKNKNDSTTTFPYVAFSHFRFDVDYGDPVLYCYELQLEKNVQRKGLGKFLMQILELMAFKNNMLKVVLTTFKHNPSGLKFFYNLNYTTDSTSPVDENGSEDDFCYFILSKINKHFQQTLA